MLRTERSAAIARNKSIKNFDSMLEGYIDFGTLPAGKKFSKKRWSIPENRKSERPKHQGNILGIPKNGLVVFDIDDPKTSGASTFEQLVILLAELDISLSNVSWTETPSGGFHVFVVWAPGVPVPKPSVDTLKNIDNRLTGDIRSSASNSYVLMPGSFVIDQDGQKEYYEPANICGLPVLSERLSQEFYDKLDGSPVNVRKKSAARTPQKVLRNQNKNKGKVAPSKHRKLLDALTAANLRTNHQKRAWLKRATSCCLSDADIANMCTEIGIDYDRNGGNPVQMSWQQVVIHLAHLDASTECGAFCEGSKRYKPSFATTISKEDAIARRQARDRAQQEYREYRVLDLYSIANSLNPGERKPGKAQKLAYQIASNELSLHLREGRTNILLGRAYLMNRYQVTNAQADRALRVMREHGVIYIHAKPVEGRTTLYRVNREFVDTGMTKVLNAAIKKNSEGKWNFHRNEVDWSDGVITAIDADTGAMTSVFSKNLEELGYRLREKHAALIN